MDDRKAPRTREKKKREGGAGSALLDHAPDSLPGALLALVPLVFLAFLAPGCEALQAPESAGTGDFYTTEYLTVPEALRVVFPDAEKVIRDRVTLSAEERTRVEESLGARLRRASFDVYLGLGGDGDLQGFAVIDEEIGKFKPITFITGIEPEGSVRRVAVMVYREARGGEVAHRRFLTQYPGKTVDDPLSINRDIINITGATMSVNSLNRGVKKALAIVETVYRHAPERVREAVERGEEMELAGEETAAASRSPGVIANAAPREATLARLRECRFVMGSLLEIEAWGESRARLRRALRAAFEEVERTDRALSDYRPESELSTVSREAFRREVEVSALTAEFLRLARRISRASEGAFDVTAGALADCWGLRSGGREREPSAEELASLEPLVDYREVRVLRGDDGRFRVRLGRDGMRLDPGALGKGFAVDRAVRALVDEGVRCALIDFAGNIYALGAPPGREAWEVAVRDPARPDALLGTVELRDEAIASSGGYGKSIEVAGVPYGHVLSPRTLRPVRGVLGATVRAPSAALADGWSTAACVLGKKAPAGMGRAGGVHGFVVLRDGPRVKRLETESWTWKVERNERG